LGDIEVMLTWAIAVAALVAVVVRPFRINEAWWACAGGVLLVALGLIAPPDAFGAIVRGLDVYAFLIGMMALAAFADITGVFTWLASRAIGLSRGSRFGLFALVYAVGVLTTATLSNDATIVVLTPAVIAALARFDAKTQPYLYACAFVANAASFILPISNPSNLLVFAGHMPALATWLRWCSFPSLAAVSVTFGVLALLFSRDLRGRSAHAVDGIALPPRYASVVLIGSACALVAVSAFQGPLGYATLALGGIASLMTLIAKRERAADIIRGISWPIVPLTAALFVIVAAIDAAGALTATQRAFETQSPLALGAIVALASNVVNNLPVGLNVGEAITALHPPAVHAFAALIGVNLGPNLSTNGSLATILWLAILRRANISASPLHFLRIGAVVTPPALVAALLALR
jgi:arsenical pump membrane protein